MRVTESDIASARGLTSIRARLRSREAHINGQRVSVPLMTGADFAELKPHLRVRDSGNFRNQILLWSALFLLAFYAVHLFWRIRQFTGDNLFLPVLLALSGIGLIVMISLRDPLRDTLMFRDFAEGALVGCRRWLCSASSTTSGDSAA